MLAKKNLAKSIQRASRRSGHGKAQRKSMIFSVAALDNNLKSFYLKTMDIVAILDSLAAVLVVLTVLGFVIVGAYLAYKEEKRKKQSG